MELKTGKLHQCPITNVIYSNFYIVVNRNHSFFFLSFIVSATVMAISIVADLFTIYSRQKNGRLLEFKI